MANKSWNPDGWAMPDNLNNQVSETLDKEPTSPEDELADALEEITRDITISNRITLIGLGGDASVGTDGGRA
jgi:hypothetical protein